MSRTTSFSTGVSTGSSVVKSLSKLLASVRDFCKIEHTGPAFSLVQQPSSSQETPCLVCNHPQSEKHLNPLKKTHYLGLKWCLDLSFLQCFPLYLILEERVYANGCLTTLRLHTTQSLGRVLSHKLQQHRTRKSSLLRDTELEVSSRPIKPTEEPTQSFVQSYLEAKYSEILHY